MNAMKIFLIPAIRFMASFLATLVSQFRFYGISNFKLSDKIILIN